jgi:acetamidase/formamidase
VGWLDPTEKPKVVVDSGDTVSIETLRHSIDEIKPGASMEEIVKLRLANPGGGPPTSFLMWISIVSPGSAPLT